MNVENSQLVQEFLDYTVNLFMCSPSTYYAYEEGMKKFVGFVEERGLTLLTVPSKVIMDYKDALLMSYRNATIRLRMSTVKSFYRFAVDQKKIEDDPFPSMRLEGPVPKLGFIPTSQEIFAIRRTGIKRLNHAALFEVLLSSGMRISEVSQIRASDIDFNVKIKDIELDRVSPYIGGAITVGASSGFAVKRKTERLTFISKLAAKVVRALMKKNNIDENSNAPILPLSRRVAWNIMNRISDPLNLKIREETKLSSPKRQGYLDINVDELDAPEDYKASVRRAQEAERKRMALNPAHEKMTRIEPPRKVRLGNHTMRHTFGIIQYYRSYNGTRHDIISVRDMMGHSNIGMTDIYIKASKGVLQNVIQNDFQWKQIMLGNGFDYMNLIK